MASAYRFVAGTASGLSETSAELGFAIGFGIVGSVCFLLFPITGSLTPESTSAKIVFGAFEARLAISALIGLILQCAIIALWFRFRQTSAR